MLRVQTEPELRRLVLQELLDAPDVAAKIFVAFDRVAGPFH
jgi:hypothetical protein